MVYDNISQIFAISKLLKYHCECFSTRNALRIFAIILKNKIVEEASV